MSHPKVTTFSIEMTPENVDEVSEALAVLQKETIKYISELAKELSVSEWVAAQIWYVRGRSRWTQELEDRMLAAAKAGHMEFNALQGEEDETLQELGF